MSKAIKITSIIALVLYLLYTIVGRMIFPLFALFGEFTIEGMAAYYIVLFLGIVPFVTFIFYTIYAFNTANSSSDHIGVEISGLILHCAVFPLISQITFRIITIVLSKMLTSSISSSGRYPYNTYAIMNSYASFLSFFGTIALSLLIISLTMSLARKKLEPMDEFN